jgi:protein-disulfide isomerase
LEKNEFLPRIKQDFSGGVRSGVNGTPTFFINGQRLDGGYDFNAIVDAVDLALE